MKQRFGKYLSLLLLLALTFGSGYLIGSQNDDPAVAQDASDQDELFVPFWEAWGLLHQFYVDPLDDNELMQGALSGMMTATGDAHTDYMGPDRYQQAQSGLSGRYEGIGATVQQDDETGELIIVRPMPGSPAEMAGIQAGDRVVSVDGTNITDLEQEVIISMVKGPAGTDVVLGIMRGDDQLEITVTRAQIDLPSMEYQVFEEDNIAYVLIYNFGIDTDVELANALRELDIQNRAGLILDVRGNPGGYLSTTLEVISMFVQSGTIYIERGANGVEEKTQAFGTAIAPRVPVVVLVDEFSASGSELLAVSLQDLERATIIGMPTFGKGSVQTWRELSNGGGIRITISRWFSPNGTSVEPDGLVPDIEVEFEPFAEDEPYSQENDSQLQAALEHLRSVVPAGPQVRQPVLRP